MKTITTTWKKTSTHLFWSAVLFILAVPVFFISADGGGNDPDGRGNAEIDPSSELARLRNPLKGIDNIPDFVQSVLNIVLTIGVPIVALAIIYSGFLFVTAQGAPDKLKKAKDTFLYVVLGAVLLLGAVVLAQAIGGTVNQLRS